MDRQKQGWGEGGMGWGWVYMFTLAVQLKQLPPALPVLAKLHFPSLRQWTLLSAEWSRSVLTHQQIQIWLSSGRGMGDQNCDYCRQPVVGYLETVNEHSGQALLPVLQCIVQPDPAIDGSVGFVACHAALHWFSTCSLFLMISVLEVVIRPKT